MSGSIWTRCSRMPRLLTRLLTWSVPSRTPLCGRTRSRTTCGLPYEHADEGRGDDSDRELAQTYMTITKLTLQVPRSHQGDALMTEFPQSAVAGSPWATRPLSRVATHGLTFQQLSSEVEAPLHQKNEARLAVAHATASGNCPPAAQDVPGIVFTGQGRYAWPSRGIASGSAKRKSGFSRRGGVDPLSITGCFKCAAHARALIWAPVHAWHPQACGRFHKGPGQDPPPWCTHENDGAHSQRAKDMHERHPPRGRRQASTSRPARRRC